MKIVSLPWYDLVEVRDANDEFWRLLWERLPSGLRDARVTRALERRLPARLQWASGRVMLSHACGYDVIFPERDRLRWLPRRATAPQVVGAPSIEAGSSYGARLDSARSWIFEEPAASSTTGRRIPGMNGLRSHIAPMHQDGRFFGSVRETGSHEMSLGEIRAERADVAAIDCVTLGLLRRHRPGSVRGLRVLSWTEAVPAPPFVTDVETEDSTVEVLLEALHSTLEDAGSSSVRAALLLDRVEVLDSAAYQPIADLEEGARRLGYPRLG